MGAVFEFRQKVLFKHCDPAGIVFFPRYFEMVNDCVEAFFDEALEWPFEVLHAEGSVPTVAIQTQFLAPSRHGDPLVLGLQVQNVGRTSMSYAMHVTCGDETRFQAQATLVHVNAEGRPVPWPDEIRARFEELNA